MSSSVPTKILFPKKAAKAIAREKAKSARPSWVGTRGQSVVTAPKIARVKPADAIIMRAQML